MPIAINGFGTAYCGKSDEDANGVYVTTVFVVALYVPIIPLASYLVRPYGGAIDGRPFLYDQSFDALQVPMNWKQVISVYLKWYAGIAVGLASIVYLAGSYVDWRYPELQKKRVAELPVLLAEGAAPLMRGRAGLDVMDHSLNGYL
jgi:hypothetical protein